MSGIYNLPWKYCECGCKGFTYGSLWMYDTLNSKWLLSESHAGFSSTLLSFVSIEALERKAMNLLSKAELAWVLNGRICLAPTAADLLEEANKLLSDPEILKSTLSDNRSSSWKNLIYFPK